jgi:hypothetical protein
MDVIEELRKKNGKLKQKFAAERSKKKMVMMLLVLPVLLNLGLIACFWF